MDIVKYEENVGHRDSFAMARNVVGPFSVKPYRLVYLDFSLLFFRLLGLGQADL